MADKVVSLAAVGDISTGLEPPEKIFEFTAKTLQLADLRFGQVERVYTERGQYQDQSIAFHSRHHPRMAEAFKSIPFNVVSIGSNHICDWGPEGAEDSCKTFQALGIPTIGAGRNIQEARQEVILTKDGLRVAFLGYVSVLLPQYWATENRAGAAPMRAHSYFEHYEFQPGSPARIVTVPFEDDLENLRADVQRVKAKADVVVVSLHWGVHFVPKPLADYQPIVAHAAIDAGASVVLGHHPHLLQAVEMYKGAPIFYSLGNFAMPRKPGTQGHLLPNGYHQFGDVYTREMEPGYTYHWNRFFNEGGIGWVEFDRSGVTGVEFIPTIMNSAGQPDLVSAIKDKLEYFREYFLWASKDIKGGVQDIKIRDNRLLMYQRK